jgi:hypothetical protein
MPSGPLYGAWAEEAPGMQGAYRASSGSGHPRDAALCDAKTRLGYTSNPGEVPC